MKHKAPTTNSEAIAAAIDKHIIGFRAERNRQIIKRHLIDGVCFEPLAEEFELSVRQVKTIVYRGEAAIYPHLQAGGETP